ncbi:hypothetical protein [Sessilibacter corallicola]|uniref:hypothetical protein n=1 Tax=Sessilibacter corallicola TaxID=2904075 RepID=UPI001E4A300F|nr:hypothetical protein [Sessilibacter corallicola]MCE2029451.1 hypothetical protein [Sessilibacter corallicola]
MKFRVIAIIMMTTLISGCLPKSAVLKYHDVQHIEAGLGVDGTRKILNSDEEVDLLATEVIELLKGQGFELLNSSVSWGLQPLTGHTQNLSFRLLQAGSIHCYVQISKKEFWAKFRELEQKPQSNEFATTNSDLVAVSKAVDSLNELAKEKFNGRSTRISKFDRAELPNK